MTQRVERRVVEEAKAKVLEDLDARRQALGFIDLSELEAELRARALEQLTPEQFTALLDLPEDRRMNQIQALEDGQRRAHAVVELRQVGGSTLDGRGLFRWRCACGAEASGDHFSADDARNAWGRHAGLLVDEPMRGPCLGCGREIEYRRAAGDYCSRACRLRNES